MQAADVDDASMPRLRAPISGSKNMQKSAEIQIIGGFWPDQAASTRESAVVRGLQPQDRR